MTASPAIVAKALRTTGGSASSTRSTRAHIAEGERCLKELKFKGLRSASGSAPAASRRRGLVCAFWEWAQDRQVPVFLHPPRVPIGHEQQMNQFKLDELVTGRSTLR